MLLPHQVVSKKFAKKLKKLGFKQDSLFYWAKESINSSSYILIPKERCYLLEEKPEWYIAAYTTDESLALLPAVIKLPKELRIGYSPSDYASEQFLHFEFRKLLNGKFTASCRRKIGFNHSKSEYTVRNKKYLSEAVCDILIYLKENNLI